MVIKIESILIIVTNHSGRAHSVKTPLGEGGAS